MTARLLLLSPVLVAGDSMEPTVRAGDVLLLLRPAAERAEERDLVAYRSPADGEVTLKRVAGTASQRVAVADGVLLVDGTEVVEPAVDHTTVDGTWFGPVTVPRGTVLVLGDSRERSTDSRHHGPVPVDDLLGVVVLRVWPPSRVGVPG